MININRHNYEEFILDFHDGQLSPSDKNRIMSFLNENPDIKAEFELFEKEVFIADHSVYGNKNELKKMGILTDLTKDNFDELCIARMEGDLTEKEEKEFDRFMAQSTVRQKEYELYTLTKLPKDHSVIFENKLSLQKQEKRPVYLKWNYRIISVAASILVLIALYLFTPNNNIIEKDFVAQDLKSLKKADNSSLMIPDSNNTILKIEKGIVPIIANNNITSSNIIVESKDTMIGEEIMIRESSPIANLTALEISLQVSMQNEIEKIAPVQDEIFASEESKPENYMSVKTFLASSFNKRVLKKENKEGIQLFDLAQAGIEGINKLTGSKMSLERRYDEKGMADKTEFNSRLIAFSAPLKKD